MKKSIFCATVAVMFGSSAAQALSINITAMHFYDALGGEQGSWQGIYIETDVSFDSTLGGIVREYSPFFGPTWNAYQVTWDNTVTGSSVNWSGTSASGPYSYNYTLGAGEVAVGLMLNWGAAVDIAILQIFDCSDAVNCIGVNNDLAHLGVPGSEMVNGPFEGQHAAFSGLAVVPVPAAVWLFGSGLVGLAGFSGRKKKIQN
jgi:hypothetical protein